MTEVLKVLRQRKLFDALIAFLRTAYPEMLKQDSLSAPQINYSELNKHKVFTHYDPTLPTYPRRLIVVADPRLGGGSLQRSVQSFCAKQAVCEHLVVEDRAYIEYLPPGCAVKPEQIPASNWQVRSFPRNS
jgi:hypothetical protein